MVKSLAQASVRAEREMQIAISHVSSGRSTSPSEKGQESSAPPYRVRTGYSIETEELQVHLTGTERDDPSAPLNLIPRRITANWTERKAH